MSQLFFLILHKVVMKKKWHFFAMILITAALGGTISIDSLLVKEILDYVTENANITEDAMLWGIVFWAFMYGLWWEVCNFLWRSYDFLYMRSLPSMKSDIIDIYFSHIQKRGHSFFKENLSGFVSNKIMDASRTCETILSNLIEKILRKIFTIGIALYALFCVKPVFASIFVIWLSVFYGISGLFMSHAQRLSSIWAATRSTISGKIIDSINNIYSIRMFNLYESENKYLSTHLNKMLSTDIALNWFMLKVRYFQGLSCSIMIFAMIYYLGLYKSRGEITLGDFALVITLSVAIMEDLWDFVQDIGDWFEDVGTFNQTLDLLESAEVEDASNIVKFTMQKGGIEFRNVCFSYDDYSILFNKLSVVIKPKQKIGIVGASGSGKTSFTNLITRLYDINSGEILIDNIDITKITQEDLRSNIAIIPQDLTLFDRTILENIRYGNLNASNEEIYAASKKARIHEDILQMHEGYNTIVGEKGCKLSGGQKQRVILARAILKDAPILILDEATSAQDPVTEEYMKESLKLLMRDKTCITIAHRISTLKNMDRILVFDKGNIVADGNHSYLYSSSKIYKELWDAQIQGYILD
ncbi:MAG: ABC transporter ATP-binding protein [Rickettsiaceae bacterium]|nr:ABC transporter ATP-binding protein [Rickettsiaceae bacterium]